MIMGVFLYSFVNLTRWQGSMPRPTVATRSEDE